MKIYYITEERWNQFQDDYELVGIVYMTLKEDRVLDMLDTFRSLSPDSDFELEEVELDDSNEFINKDLVKDERVYAYLNNNKE